PADRDRGGILPALRVPLYPARGGGPGRAAVGGIHEGVPRERAGDARGAGVRQLVIPRFGPPEVLEVREAPEPRVGPGTVHMLVRVAAVQHGETVLVHAAAGGVGLAVAELGRILGFRVLGLASPAKHEVLREYGVEPLDSRDPRWFDAVRVAAPQGVDVVLDA